MRRVCFPSAEPCKQPRQPSTQPPPHPPRRRARTGSPPGSRACAAPCTFGGHGTRKSSWACSWSGSSPLATETLRQQLLKARRLPACPSSHAPADAAAHLVPHKRVGHLRQAQQPAGAGRQVVQLCTVEGAPTQASLQGSMRGERHRSSLEHQVRLGPVLDQVPARHRGWQQTIRHGLQPAFSRTAAAAAFIQSARLHKALTAGCAHLTCERNWGSEKPPPGAHRRLSVPLATLGWLPFARPDCSRQQHSGC